jgi:hypothetical protein
VKTFVTSWLPNIVCTIAGCSLSWAIGYWQGKEATRTTERQTHLLVSILTNEEELGHMILVRDTHGNIMGGRVDLRSTVTTKTSVTGTITTAPSAVSSTGHVIPAGTQP